MQIESAGAGGFLDRYKVLLLTYEGQKPPTPAFHDSLANWVRAGGALVVIDDDRDPFNSVREWWNTAPMKYATPRHHLFEKLGLAADAGGLSHVGKGVVIYESLSPAALTHQKNGGTTVRDLARQAAEAIGVAWKETNALALRRGPYVIAAGLDESVPGAPPAILRGNFVPLFDAALPTVKDFTLDAGRRALLLDVTEPRSSGMVLAAACRITQPAITNGTVHFRADGIERSQAIICIALEQKPRDVQVVGKSLPTDQWNYSDGLLRIHFENSADGIDVEVVR